MNQKYLLVFYIVLFIVITIVLIYNESNKLMKKLPNKYTQMLITLEERKKNIKTNEWLSGKRPYTVDLNITHMCGGRLKWGEDSVLNERHADHLWIIHRAIDLLSDSNDKEHAVKISKFLKYSSQPINGQWISTTFHDSLVKGLYDTDHMNPWGTNVFACHFFSHVTGANYFGDSEYTSPVYTKKSGNLMKKIYDDMKITGFTNNLLLEFFYYLGVICHYLTDQTQPMHAHNLPNALRPANDKFHSAYEDFSQNFINKQENKELFKINRIDVTNSNTWNFSDTNINNIDPVDLMTKWVLDASKDAHFRYNHPFSYPGDGFMPLDTVSRYTPIPVNYPEWAKDKDLITRFSLGPATIGPFNFNNTFDLETGCTIKNCWTDLTYPEIGSNKYYNIDENCYFGFPHSVVYPINIKTDNEYWKTAVIPSVILSTRQAITITAGFIYSVFKIFFPEIINKVQIPEPESHSSILNTDNCMGGYQCIFNGKDCVSIYNSMSNKYCNTIPGSTYSDQFFGNYGTCSCTNPSGTSCNIEGDNTLTCVRPMSINPQTGSANEGTLLNTCSSNSSTDINCKLQNNNCVCQL